MMRNGRLLAEAAPDDLIRRYNMLTLEDVFLLLALAEENVEDDFFRKESDTSASVNTDSFTPSLNLPKERQNLNDIRSAGQSDDDDVSRIFSLVLCRLLIEKLVSLLLLLRINYLLNQEEMVSYLEIIYSVWCFS